MGITAASRSQRIDHALACCSSQVHEQWEPDQGKQHEKRQKPEVIGVSYDPPQVPTDLDMGKKPGDKLDEGAGKASMRERFHIGLWDAEEQKSHEEGNEEAQASLTEKVAACACAQCKPAGRSGQHKEKGNTPREEERYEGRGYQAPLRILDEPIREVIEWKDGVKEKDAQHGQHAHPIKIEEPFLLCVCCYLSL